MEVPSYGLPVVDWGSGARELIAVFESTADGPDPEGAVNNPTGPGNAGTPMASVREAAYDEVRPGRALGQGARQRRRRREALDPEPWLAEFDKSDGDAGN